MTLDEQIAVIEADLKAKLYRRDWHGVMDCAADIRELEAQKRVLPDHVYHGVLTKPDGSRWYCSGKSGHAGPCAAWPINHEAADSFTGARTCLRNV
jgi:hypothetical protein